MVKWKVSLTVEKIIEAKNRASAKAILIQEVRYPKVDVLGDAIVKRDAVFSFTDRNDECF